MEVEKVKSYKRLNSSFEKRGDTCCGFELDIYKKDETIYTRKVLYMAGRVVDIQTKYFDDIKQAEQYCTDYVKDFEK